MKEPMEYFYKRKPMRDQGKKVESTCIDCGGESGGYVYCEACELNHTGKTPIYD